VAVPLRLTAALAVPGEAPAVSTYREYRPCPSVARAVSCTWHGVPGWSRRLRVLPDGCLDLVWDGKQVRAVRPAPGPARYPIGPGPPVTGIRIRPGWAALVLGVPLRLLPEVTDLADLADPSGSRRFEAALAAAPGPAARRGALTRAVAGALAEAAGPDREVLGAVRALGQPRASVGGAARAASLSPRQLRRRFGDHVGLPPKTLQAILRFQRLRTQLAAARITPSTLARAAADCGYFDQPHLCLDCRRLAGLTPSALLGALAQDHHLEI
jgi:AraC-like DNA-binding protein